MVISKMGGFTNNVIEAVELNSAQFIGSQITQMGVGKSDTPFDGTQTGLQDEVLKVPMTSVQVIGNEVRTRARLDVTQANDETIREIGEFTAGDTMVSRSLITPKEKTSEKEFIFIKRSTITARNL